ncbi:MAG TPA: hypothetical protein VMD59_03425 [Acidimicrobiales bacterium]|nr:hypothetical protein [Acidimicrobiales bacterium]
MWVTGDQTTGVGWKIICKHLRGQLAPAEYEQVGICFRVDKIANYGNHTLFVSLTEVAAVGAGLAKNPFNGNAA